ncbi:S41 family peptidase [Spirillospora sp. NPDC048911]|uniref:S41 family peptidase n=1 Tax=Spirillospora sp. NPDC048911 TaxID=3364527 RepID=UPI00371F1080
MTEARAVTLPEFLEANEIGRLSVEDRRLIVQQALLVLEQNYALLPFKTARYGINPVQRLRVMQARLGRPGPPESEWRFHAELVDIFNSLRDLHTRYTLPRPFSDAVARLPFLLKEFTEDNRRRYLVGRRIAGQAELPHETFRFGVELTHWNGVPIDRAVERHAERFPGANPAARHARAVERFTVRSLAFGPPPDEDWVTLRYLDHDGEARFIQLTWDVSSIVPETSGPNGQLETPFGYDVEGLRVARLRTELFAPEFIAAEESGEPADPGPEGITVTPEMATVFEARRVTAANRVFGHLRIRTFVPTASGVEGFVREFIRLLGELPSDGLIVDIRGNLGGAIVASELCLQALTARAVEPEPAQFAATLLNLRICRANDVMAEWLPSMEQALETGAPYSAAIPFTPPEALAEIPQSYFGPVILLTDARCYSAADIFAAGFQDNQIGPILGIDGNTGAGGGNVWRTANLLGSLPSADDFPFRPLPNSADLSLVIRRLLRVGAHAGTPLEDFGVIPDERHIITRQDVLNNDADLMATAAALLGKGEPRRLQIALAELDGELTLTFEVLGVDRADVIVDGRPRATADFGGGIPAPVRVPNTGTPRTVRIEGYDGRELVAVRTFVRTAEGLELRTTI